MISTGWDVVFIVLVVLVGIFFVARVIYFVFEEHKLKKQHKQNEILE